MKSLISCYISAAAEYQREYDLRCKDTNWNQYKTQTKRLAELIAQNQKDAAVTFVPLLKATSGKGLKFVRLQEKTKQKDADSVYVRCEDEVAYCPNLRGGVVSIIKTIPVADQAQSYRLEDDLRGIELCCIKVIGKGDERMCVYPNASMAELEDLAARTFVLYQNLKSVDRCYQQAKKAYKAIVLSFYYKYGKADLFVDKAPTAIKKAQKWIHQLTSTSLDLECYLNAIDDFEEAHETRSTSECYLHFKREVGILAQRILAEVCKSERQLVLPHRIEGALLRHCIEKFARREGLELICDDKIQLSSAIILHMPKVLSAYYAMVQDPVYADYQKSKFVLHDLVVGMDKSAILSGVSPAYTKISKWTS